MQSATVRTLSTQSVFLNLTLLPLFAWAATACGGDDAGPWPPAASAAPGFEEASSARQPTYSGVDDEDTTSAPLPPRTNRYFPRATRSIPVFVPVNAATLVTEEPFGCYGGDVTLEWGALATIGALPHELLLDGVGLACHVDDLEAVREEAADNGGFAEAELRITPVDAIQFGWEGECSRGLYEHLELRFSASERVFHGFAYFGGRERLDRSGVNTGIAPA